MVEEGPLLVPKPAGLKVAVVGSRNYTRLDLVRMAIEVMHDNVTVVSGSAKGVDQYAEKIARSRGLAVEIYPAEWEKFGKRAGFVRNEKMVEVSDWVLAFWDGVSKGTAHTIRIAAKAGKLAGVVGDYGQNS